jgi:hypothetical protein
MTTYILTWDGSDTGYPPQCLNVDIADTASGRMAYSRWSYSFDERTQNLDVRDRLFLLRQGKVARGVVASGYPTTGVIFKAAHWDTAKNSTGRYMFVRWDMVLSMERRLQYEGFDNVFANGKSPVLRRSGEPIDPAAALRLEITWVEHLHALADRDKELLRGHL